MLYTVAYNGERCRTLHGSNGWCSRDSNIAMLERYLGKESARYFCCSNLSPKETGAQLYSDIDDEFVYVDCLGQMYNCFPNLIKEVDLCPVWFTYYPYGIRRVRVLWHYGTCEILTLKGFIFPFETVFVSRFVDSVNGKLCNLGVFRTMFGVEPVGIYGVMELDGGDIKIKKEKYHDRVKVRLDTIKVDNTRRSLSFICSMFYDIDDFEVADSPYCLFRWQFLCDYSTMTYSVVDMDTSRYVAQGVRSLTALEVGQLKHMKKYVSWFRVPVSTGYHRLYSKEKLLF